MGLVDSYHKVKDSLAEEVCLVAVSKTKPTDMILSLYDEGHRDFGENKVQDLVAKYEELPKDIQWHFIGHLQSNKVKYIAPFVHLLHGVDSLKLLKVIDKEGRKNERVIDCLLQVHIATESTKFGFSSEELLELIHSGEIAELKHVRIRGLMGMATNTDVRDQVREEFRNLKRIFDKLKSESFSGEEGFGVLSMGMSNDYELALAEGSNMLRIGSTIFGLRNYANK